MLLFEHICSTVCYLIMTVKQAIILGSYSILMSG